MQTAYISIGSNIEPKEHIRNALIEMRATFDNVDQSSIYESEAVGFKGDNFLNLVVKIDTRLSVGELNEYLHELEDAEGRERSNGKAWDSRTLDLDVLLFADIVGEVDGLVLPRDEILEHAHVLQPLAEMAGDEIHPATDKTYEQLSAEIQFEDQKIWLIDL
jgi:2-amino-4-hydroxy-6-hydroxymethyldihydropteridine diphosphokinase